MQSKEQSFPSLDFEKEIERAKWFKEDFDKGSWNQRYNLPEFASWTKTFPEEQVPVKTIFVFRVMPMPAEKFAEMVHPSNMELRAKWDDGFKDLETLEVGPDGARIVFMRTELSWPLTDRTFVLYMSLTKEIDWYGKKAFVMFAKDASHPSKPPGEDGFVRVTNGGNIYIAIPDENEPETKCQVFGLTNNNFNGWLPNVEWVVSRSLFRVFRKLQKNIVEGYNKYFKN